MASSTVAIIGAGPVGLFAAFLLAKKGISITVCEAAKDVDESPRACVWFPAVLEELDKAGLLEDVLAAGESNSDGVAWRDTGGNVLAAIDPPPESSTYVVALPQPDFCRIVLGKLSTMEHVSVLFDCKFQRLQQQGGVVTYWTKHSASNIAEERKCTYLIGADGGKSSVRANIGVELEGHTWDRLQFVAVNFDYPLSGHGWKAANFIVDPVDFAIVVKRGKGNQWRFATAVKKSEFQRAAQLDDEIVEIVKDRMRRILPGDTDEIEYKLIAPYIVHNRCATTFRRGNVFLAGDAAHLNNPVGALGLTTGLLDAVHLSGNLSEVLIGDVSDSILDACAEIPRRIFLERTDPVSTANLNRLFSQEPDHIEERKEAFSRLKNPRDFVILCKMGLQDHALTTTSDTIYDTSTEVTWFISVTKIADWTEERFLHEYKGVHATMTREGVKAGSPVQHYVQVENIQEGVAGCERPEWNFVTCLTIPNLFINHKGLAHPGYKATAGAHIFCRLDQQGCLAAEVHRHARGGGSSNDVAIRILYFHRRSDHRDEARSSWLQERVRRYKSLFGPDERLVGYVLWRDITPKKPKKYFHDTQFVDGSWLEFKAVEAFDFSNMGDAKAFLQSDQEDLTQGARDAVVVLGKPDVVF